MRKILTILTMTMSLYGWAQNNEYNPQTLLGNKDKSVRGFIGVGAKGFEMNNQIALLAGGEIDLVFGHRLNIGFFGYGKTNTVQSDLVDTQGFRHFYELGIGGLKIERVFFTNSVFHITVPVRMGLGGLTLNKYSVWDYDYYSNNNYNNWESSLYDFDTFVFIEPGVNLEINLFKHLRLDAGVGYLMTDEVRLAGTDAYPLNNLIGNISLRLGWF